MARLKFAKRSVERIRRICRVKLGVFMPFRQWLLVAAVFSLALGAHSAFACLNDTSVRAGEDEFRSRYDVPQPSDHVQSGGVNPWGVAGLALGSGLIAGAFVGGIRRQKSGDK